MNIDDRIVLLYDETMFFGRVSAIDIVGFAITGHSWSPQMQEAAQHSNGRFRFGHEELATNGGDWKYINSTNIINEICQM